jgi:mannose-6-phosphate isomerase
VIVYEVQQASDLTYRLHDHGRLGADGRPRQLHLPQALAVARLSPGGAPAPEPIVRASGRVELARTDAFVLEAVDPRTDGIGPDGVAWVVGPDSFELLTDLGDAGTARTGTLRWHGGEATVTPGSSWLLPAGLGPVALRGPSPSARCWVPGAEAAP